MPSFEYKVVPAPSKGLKAKGLKTPEARFSNALETLMNEQAAEGWEYQRAETLPSTERSGLTGSVTEWRNVLVFRRAAPTTEHQATPELLPAPSDQTPADTSDESLEDIAPETSDDSGTASDENTLSKGMEETPDEPSPSASLNKLAETRNSFKSSR